MNHSPQSPPPAASSQSLLSLARPSYFILATLGRLPFAMTVVGVFTLVVVEWDSYALGGLTSAVTGITTALSGPFIGWLADRIGQRIVLLVSGLINALALVLITVLVYAHVSLPLVLLTGVLVGVSSPQVSPMSRSRLIALIQQRQAPSHQVKTIDRAMSLESVIDESMFVLGPVIVGLLAATVGPWSPIVIAAVFTLVSVWGFALHSSVAVVPGTGSTRHKPDATTSDSSGNTWVQLRQPPILILAAGMLAIGVIFGSSLTSVTAFLGQFGQEASGGVLYGAMGLGSAIFALAINLLPTHFIWSRRLLFTAVVVALGAFGMAVAPTVAFLALALFLAGCGIGPSLVALFTLGSSRSPAALGTTVMAILTGGIMLGQSVSNAVVGALVQGRAPVLGFLVVVGAAVTLLFISWINLRIDRRIPPHIRITSTHT